jgi:hypothetical protein
MRVLMKAAVGLFLCIALNAQAPATPGWRQTFHGLLGRPPGSLTARDLQQMETELALASQYCTGLAPGDYEANRALVRQMATYLATVQVAGGDQTMHLSLRRLTRSLAAFPCAYAIPPGQQAAGEAPPSPASHDEAPFGKTAPVLHDVPKADQATAQDLGERYNIDAGHAATAWKNAEAIRRGLEAKAMSLNAQTAASVDHLKLFLDQAADAMLKHRWDDALSSLQAVEAETQKISKSAGN